MSGTVWEALSAIGTLGAVVVALGIAGHSAWANRRAENDRSELAAAKMLSPLSAIERKAAYLSVCFAFAESDFAEPNPNVLAALDELEALARAVSIEDLYPLLKLPRHAAKRSARALGLIQTFVNETYALLAHKSWPEMDNRQRAIHYSSWLQKVSEIQDHLTVAVSVCESAA